MGQYWGVQRNFRGGEFEREIPDFEAAMLHRGQRVSGEDDSAWQVYARDMGGCRYFFKIFVSDSYRLSDFLVRSRLKTEWDNLLMFHRLGIPAPLPVAFGESRKWGMTQRGVLVSEEVVGAIELARLADTRPDLFLDREWYASLCQQLGGALGCLHRRGFAHNDLNWRNVLVTLEPSLRVYFFDCPRGRRWFWPFRSFRVTKDLTHLDKMGRRYLSRTQRLRFYLAYAGRDRLTRRDKRTIRRVLGRTVDAKYGAG